MATKRLTISLPEQFYEEIGQLAKREHRTLSEFAREALRRYASRTILDEDVVYPWERQLVAERLAAYRENPDAVFSAEEVHTAALASLRKPRG